MARISSLCERPRSDRPRRLANWLNPTGEQKVHSLIPSISLPPGSQAEGQKALVLELIEGQP